MTAIDVVRCAKCHAALSSHDDKVCLYLQTLHLAEAVPKEKGARSRRRRWRRIDELFGWYRRTVKP